MDNNLQKTREYMPLVQSLLFASGEPLDLVLASEILGLDSEAMTQAALDLKEKLSGDDCGVEVVQINEKFQLATKSKYESQIRKVLAEKKNSPLSTAAFEVLAVVSYNQPVTRAFIEQVRGVDCSSVINTLCERNLIRESGRLDLPGRPLVYCTTDNFLRCFNMKTLDELPKIPEKIDIDSKKNENLSQNELEGQLTME